MSQTLLAQRLTLPVFPDPPEVPSSTIGTVLIAVGSVLLLLARGPICVVAAGVSWGEVWPLPFFLLPVGGGCLVGGLVLLRDVSRSKAKCLDELKGWQCRRELALAVWDRLYCCTRDDVVFDPLDGRHSPVADLASFLWSREQTRPGTSGDAYGRKLARNHRNLATAEGGRLDDSNEQ